MKNKDAFPYFPGEDVYDMRTLRDHFAMAALRVMSANIDSDDPIRALAERAYAMADAMLIERINNK